MHGCDLQVELWDYTSTGRDYKIGSTRIDLEDRWFNRQWHEAGRAHATRTRFAPKPLERRPLWNPRFKSPQGTVELWVDMLTPLETRRCDSMHGHVPRCVRVCDPCRALCEQVPAARHIAATPSAL